MIKTAAFATVIVMLPAAASATGFTNGDFEDGLNGWSTSGRVETLLGSVYANGIGTGATPAQRDHSYAFFGSATLTNSNTLSQSCSTLIGRT
jgi:hypothetical protein